jgi:hypothetical protein
LLDLLLRNLPPEHPAFTYFQLRDENPLGRYEKTRRIGAPNRTAELIHSRINNCLRDRRWLPFATGALPYCSPRSNVLRHRFSRFFYLTDIHAAYPSVNPEKLAEILEEYFSWYEGGALRATKDELLVFLKRLCVDKQSGGLIVGAPASPYLFNLYAEVLIDRPLGALCRKYRLAYSRYLDDLTFSSRSRIGEKKRKAIREIIQRAGFSINHRKSRVHDLRKGPIEITGIGLEYGGRIYLPRHYLRRIKGVLHAAVHDPVNFQQLVSGMMGLFFGITHEGSRLNSTERDIIDGYKHFREVLLQERCR